MSTHSAPPLSDGLAPTAHASPPETAVKQSDKPDSPQPQPQPFSSTVPGYARTPSGIDPTGVPSNTSRTARAASSDLTTLLTSLTVMVPALRVINAASAEENKLNEGLAASAEDARTLIDHRPSFLQAVSKTLFPAAVPPVDLSRVYVSEYSENYTGSSGDAGGAATLQRRVLDSHKLIDVLAEALRTGQAPSFMSNGEKSYGLFTQPNVVDAGSALGGVTPADFKNRLDELARDPASALQNSTDDYFNNPATPASGLSPNTIPKDALSSIYGAQLKAEAELRTIDGTLKPEHKALIDQVLAHPHPSAEERKLATTPKVYGISVIIDRTPPGLTIPGGVLIADNHAESDKTACVFCSPTGGIQPFDSLQDFKDHVFKQNLPQLLSALSDEDAAKLTDRLDGLQFGLNQLDENVFGYSVKTQLERHKSDTAYAFKEAREKGMTDPDELDMVGRNLSEPLTASFDANRVEARRYAAWVEQNRPAWWKSASEQDRTQLDQLEQDSKHKADALHDLMQERVPPLRDYAVQRIKDYLQAKYPGADIDPDAIQVQSHAVKLGRPVPQPSVSLTQFVLNNVKTKWDLIANPKLNPQWHASFTGKNGEQITLLQNDLHSLARDLNVGQGHQDLIKQRMLSSEGNNLRQGWKDSYVAQLRVDAKEARLSGALDDSGYDQITALLDHPDSLGKPNEPLQISYFLIGSLNGRTGASVEGVLMIAKKNAKPNDPMLLCTPNAPDGVNIKAYPNGMDGVNRDRRFKGKDWETYFKNRVSENVKPFLDQQFKRGYDIFNRGSLQASSFRELEDKLYEAHVRRHLADTQTLAKSNQQLDAETAGDLFLYAMDIVTSAADIVAPARAAMKGLRRLLNPYKAIASLNDLPYFARIVQKGVQRPATSMGSAMPKRAMGRSALHDVAATHHMNIVDVPGHRQNYLAPRVPDQPRGEYLLRAVDPNHGNQLVSTGIIAKPELRNGKLVWRPNLLRLVAPGRNRATAGSSLGGAGTTPPTSPNLGGAGAAASTSQQGNQAALMDKYNAAPTLRERQIAFNNLSNDFYDNVSTSTYPPRPTLPSLRRNATTTELIDSVYSSSNGLVLGEKHNNVSSIKFLYDNLANFKRNGVTTLYVEGFEGRWITKAKLKKTRLGADSDWDRKRYGWPYTVGNLYEKAEELGIRVIGIDNHLLTHSAGFTNRLKYMNYWAKTKILMDQQENPGKWLAFVGQGHMKTSGRTPVPGLSEILGAIGVEIHPAAKAVPTFISAPGPGWQTFMRIGNGDFRINLNIDDVALGRRPVLA